MAQCPKCGTVIDSSGFMIVCHGCKATPFFDADGNLVDPEANITTDQRDAAERAEQKLNQLPEQTQELGVSQGTSAGFDPMAPFPALEQDRSFDAPLETQDQIVSAGDGFNFEPPSASTLENTGLTPLPHQHDFGPADDLLGLNSYANSEMSQAKDGLLLFRILISGIDSKEVKDSIREALEDSRFGWNTSELMAQVNKGRLKIENVSPVKASILINRIKSLPVRVRWEQNAITQLEGP